MIPLLLFLSATQVMDCLGVPAFGSEEQAVQHGLQLMQLYAEVQGLYEVRTPQGSKANVYKVL